MQVSFSRRVDCRISENLIITFRDCFFKYCVHKYRSTFGKSKLVRDGERILLGFNGGQGSSAMLHLTKEVK